MNVTAIRSELERRAACVPGVTAYAEFGDSIVAPAAVVIPDEPFIAYTPTINGRLATLNFRLTLLAQRTSMEDGQRALDEMLSLGEGSVVDALYEDGDEPPPWSSIAVSEARDYGATVIENVSYLKVDLAVAITARRSA